MVNLFTLVEAVIEVILCGVRALRNTVDGIAVFSIIGRKRF
jgi:hypothetical protein